jgi:AmmeMemoRadiSam system protein A
MKKFCLLAMVLTLGTAAFLALGTPPTWGGAADMNLTAADKQLLLQVARDSIKAQLQGKAATPVQVTSPVMEKPRGAFVSLHRQGQLRGCIGYIEAVKPLLQTVRDMAPAAAFQDPRFRPLQSEELKDLEIEISILSPLKLVQKPEEIQVGQDGLYIVRGINRGLLLPQVATQYHWDRVTFLEQTCRKAGLGADAWKDPHTQIYKFQAEIFSDH